MKNKILDAIGWSLCALVAVSAGLNARSLINQVIESEDMCQHYVTRSEVDRREGQSGVIRWGAWVDVPGEGPCAQRPTPQIYPGFETIRDATTDDLAIR